MPEPSSAATAALFRKQLRTIGERLELQRVAAGVEQEHRGLLAGLALEADRRLDHEARAGRRSRRGTVARTGRAGFRRMGLKEPSAALGSSTRGIPGAKRHSKRPGLGTRRARRRRKRARPGTRGSHAPLAGTRVRLAKTRRRDSESQVPVEKRRSWYWGESRAGLFVQCEWHPGCEAGIYRCPSQKRIVSRRFARGVESRGCAGFVTYAIPLVNDSGGCAEQTCTTVKISHGLNAVGSRH